MERKLIIDGNAVYEIDEKCMLKKHLEEEEALKRPGQEDGGRDTYQMKRAE